MKIVTMIQSFLGHLVGSPPPDPVTPHWFKQVTTPTEFFGRQSGTESYRWYSAAPVQTIARGMFLDDVFCVEVMRQASPDARRAFDVSLQTMDGNNLVIFELEETELRLDELWSAA